MKRLFNLFGVEVERLGLKLSIVLLVLYGTIALFAGELKIDAYFIGMCVLVGICYHASIVKKSKIEVLSKNVKQLLTENHISGSPIGLNADLDSLNQVMKDIGPLMEQMGKNAQQSKHFRNRQNDNNKKQILNNNE
jgi:hypothetical protein